MTADAARRLLTLAGEIDALLDRQRHVRGPIRARDLLARVSGELRSAAAEAGSGLSASEAKFVLSLYARPGLTVAAMVRRLAEGDNFEPSPSAAAIVARGLAEETAPRPARKSTRVLSGEWA